MVCSYLYLSISYLYIFYGFISYIVSCLSLYQVRTETKIASGAVSVSSAAAELCQMKLPTGDYNDARILIVGAGKMSRLLVKHLASKGCKEMTILNRSLPRAEELKNDFPDCDIKIGLMDELVEATEASDVIFVASSSDEPVLAKAQLEALKPASAKVTKIHTDISHSSFSP